ncbi:MAG: DUF418 domain-containing protein [Planctomycetes bacterium]|nr:DUF418 domain-containing protein [Planctomycetota bacterium]
MESEGPTIDDPGCARLAGVDLARGLAYLGMVAVNFHLVMTWGRTRASLVPAPAEALIESLFGRCAAAFVLIAGLSLSLRSRRPPAARPGRAALIGSRIALLVFGALAVLGAAFHADRAARRGLASIGGLGRRADWGHFLADLLALPRSGFGPAGRSILVAGGAALVLLALSFLVRPGLYRGPRGGIFLRALFLLGLGYLWQPIWSGDILHFYGLWLLLALPLLRAPSWALLALALATALGAAGLHLLWDYRENWSATLEPLRFWTGAGQLRDLLFDGWHPLLPWFGFLLVGLVLGRCRLDGRRAPILALILGLVLVVAAPPLVRAGSAAVIAVTDLGGGFEPAPAAPAPTPGPDRPLFARGAIPIEEAAPATTDPALRAGARFLAGRLDWARIEAIEIDPAEDPGLLVLRLRAGADQAELDRQVTGLLRWLQGLDDHPAWPVAVARLRVEARDRQGDVVAVAIDARTPGRLPFDERVRIVLGLDALPPGPFFFVQALGSALVLVALALLLVRVGPLRRLLRPVVLAGRAAFSLYLLHVLIGMGGLDQLRLLGGQGLPLCLAVIVVTMLLSLAFASAWLALFRRGPVEALMRWLAR